MVAPMPSQITALLETWQDPYLQQNLVEAKVIQEIAIHQDSIALRLQYPYPLSRKIPQLKQSLSTLLQKSWPDYEIICDIRSRIRTHQAQEGVKPKPGIKNIIAVASGKGGVGKSTVAVNLALALHGQGAKVALLDADIYGPSQPRMLGKQGIQARTVDKKLIPIQNFGIQSISMGYLVEEQTPMVWRGPMVSGALQQLLNDTAWEECDYMILDLPPGTGDIQLTMAQKLPISAAVVVTTPQDIALLDARKAYKMFEKVGVPVLGVIENMSWHICGQCGHQEAIFGAGGGEKMAQEYALPLLAQLPLDASVRAQGDAGVPIVAHDPEGAVAQKYWECAQRVSALLALRKIDYTAAIPEIVIQA